MQSAIVVPRTVVLPLAMNGWTVTVHEELNHGQFLSYLMRSADITPEGEMKRNPIKAIDALTVAYLVDWTLTGENGSPIEIRDLKPDEVQDTLNNLRVSVAREVRRAVQKHDDGVSVTTEDQKKIDSTDVSSPQTLQSVA